MPTMEGVVSAVSIKERKTAYGTKMATSFQIDGNWYSGGFRTWEIEKGDQVRCTWKENDKGYKDVTGMAVLSKGATPSPTAKQSGVPASGRRFPIDPFAPERTINRQNALTAAANIVNGVNQSDPSLLSGEDIASVVIHYARRFEAYTTGDLDREEAEKMVESTNGDIQT